jgi:hypothetical protein
MKSRIVQMNKQCGNYQELGYWMTFYIPLGSLGDVYPTEAYPFNLRKEPSPELWLTEINSFMEGIARFIYREIRFEIGVIGYEVDPSDIVKMLAKGLPSERWEGILLPRDDQLDWYPPTIYEAPYTVNKILR